MAIVAAIAAPPPIRGKTVRKLPREMLVDLRNRAGMSAAEVARALGYSSTNGYIRYEYPTHGDKLIPYKVVRQLIPLFVGRGSPPVTSDELVAITEARTIGQDAPSLSVGQSPLSVSGLLKITYRVEPGVFLDESAAGAKTYGESNIAPAFDIVPSAQFAAVLDDVKRTVVHCVKAEQVGQLARVNKRCVCLVARGTSGLVEVVLRTADDKGNVAGAKIVGVVIGSYARE